MSALQVIPAAEAPDLTLMPRADLPAIWGGYDKQKEPLVVTAAGLIAADPALPATQKLARSTRLALRSLRCEIENKRKELVEGYKKTAAGIDAKAREFKTVIEPLEAQLFQIEQYAEIQEAARLAALVKERAEFLTQFGTDLAPYNLGAMTQEKFDELFEGEQAKHFAKIKADKEAEEARAAKAKADDEERQRIMAENDRIKAEAAKAAAEARANREKLEVVMGEIQGLQSQVIIAHTGRLGVRKGGTIECIRETLAETEAWPIVGRFGNMEPAALKAKESALESIREMLAAAERDAETKAEAARVESQLAEERAKTAAREATEAAKRKADEAAELARKKAEQAAARKAANAPDAEKLKAYAQAIRMLATPLLSESHVLLESEIADRRIELAEWIEAKAASL